MSVNKEKHEELAGKWSPIVAECDARDIGESIDVWCEKKGISKWKLYYWKKALKNSASAEHPCKTETAGQCLDITDALSDSGADPARREDYPKYFESVTENHPLRELSPVNDARPSSCPSIMIQSGSFHIYVGDGVSEATLATVLKAVPHD